MNGWRSRISSSSLALKSASLGGVCLVLCVAACSSQPSSTAQHYQGGASSTGFGGSSASHTGGAGTTITSASVGGTSGGISSGNGGSTTIGAGGGSQGNLGGTGTNGVGGNGSGGVSAAGGGTTSTGGTSQSNAGGTTADTTGGGNAGAAGSSSGVSTGGRADASGGASNGGTSSSAGGSASGGAQTGGSPAASQLITSGQNDYFNTTRQATIVTSGTADLTVDETTTYQRWDGFGGTFNEMGWDALSALSSAEVTNALTLLFDPDQGANLVYGRLPMGASDYSTSWYTLDDASGADYSMNSFSISRDTQKLIPFIKAALAIRPDLRLWASPWVVPNWMLDGSSNMKSDAQTLTAHALYMAKFVEEYAKQGLTIWAVHPQNEPGYARLHWTQANLINFVKSYLGPTFAERKLDTEIWFGTMSKDPDDTNIALAAAKDAEAMKYIKGFGVQWNPLAAVPTLAAKAPVMQTEHRCGNYNFTTEYWNSSQYNTSKAQNDHAYGEESWQLIRDWAVAGVNSYSAWNMVLDTAGKSLDGWPQNALLVVDRSAKKLIQTPAYYVFRQFSQFVLPGATRISAASSAAALKGLNTQTWNGVNAVAFKNADGTIVTQVYNKGASAQTLIVKVGGTMYQISVPAHGWDTLKVSP